MTLKAKGLPCRTALAALLLAWGASAAGTVTLDDCAERVRDHGEDLESYRCYWMMARKGEEDGALRALEALLAINPSDHRAQLYLAAIEKDRGRDRAEELFREAAEGFASLGQSTGEIYARLSLCDMMRQQGRLAEAETEIENASRIADATDDPILRARVGVNQATIAMHKGDHTNAVEILREAESRSFPDGPADLRLMILSQLGYSYWTQGLTDQALEVYTRQAEMSERLNASYEEASARYNVALLSRPLFEQGRMERDEFRRNLTRALELAIQVGNRKTESSARLLLGRLTPGEQGIRELERSLAIKESIGDLRGANEARRHLAYVLWEEVPERRSEALRLIGQATGEARSTGDLPDVARGLIGRAGMLQSARDRDEWGPAYEEAIEAVEKMRQLQPDGTAGARLFSRWAYAYYRLSGNLLRGLPSAAEPDSDLDLAFRTIERMRSRVLIDELDAARALPRPSGDNPDVRRRAEILGEIAAVQRELANPSVPPGNRKRYLERLDRLEAEEAARRDAIARVDRTFAALRQPVIPGVEDVQERLAPDQAILSYQLSGSKTYRTQTLFEGGSWVVVISRDQAFARALPELDLIEDRVGLFFGLCRRRDGSEESAAVTLYDDLLREPLEEIAPSVKRLVIVPDDHLHRLPFAALRPGPGETPLGTAYDIAQVPSVALWMRWQESGGEQRRDAHAVLAVADPDIGGVVGSDAVRAANPWVEGLRLGSLPRARSEARRMVRSVGGASRLVAGPEASERFLKQIDLGPYGILHFAAHAVVDDTVPDRSAVVLAAGAEGEDGFLQIREIIDLDLKDKIIVLSTCRGASGTTVLGEGVLGLARGFFQAGARAVIASLWPLRDDEAEAFIGELSRELARGSSLARAAADARSSRIRAGAPAAAWAGLVVLGNGDLVPVPGGSSENRRWIGWLVPGLSAVLILTVAAYAFRRYRTAAARATRPRTARRR